MKHPADLFPETLLVAVIEGQPMTTSRKVAEHFDNKQHKDVLRVIENLRRAMPDLEFWRRNFAPRDYVDARGKTQPEYRLTRDAFTFLAMRFTGREAMTWQIAFLHAFNAMEAELHAKTARYAHALDQVRPNLRPTVEDAELGLPRAATAASLGKSAGAITYHRGAARRLGLLAARGTRA